MPPSPVALLALLLSAFACARAPDPALTHPILDRHLAAVGAEPPAAIQITGTIGHGSVRVPLVTFVRARPFAFRRELGPRGGPTPPAVMITDGATAWDAAGRLLDADTAPLCFEMAFVDGQLYRRGEAITASSAEGSAWQLHDHANLPPDCPRNLRTRWLAMRTPAGTQVQCHFDLTDDLLVETAVPDALPAPRWTRYLDWRWFGTIRLPARQWSGMVGHTHLSEYRVDEVRFPASLPDELFAGSPRRQLTGHVDAGPLVAVPTTVPGSAALVATDVLLDGRRRAAAFVDTGATQGVVIPTLAGSLALPARSHRRIATLTGTAEHPQAWLQQLQLGAHLVPQRTVLVLELPPAVGLPADQQPGLLLGTDVLFEGAPVFDFAAGRLWLRGRPAEPLAATALRPVLRVPLFRAGTTLELHGPVKVALQFLG